MGWGFLLHGTEASERIETFCGPTPHFIGNPPPMTNARGGLWLPDALHVILLAGRQGGAGRLKWHPCLNSYRSRTSRDCLECLALQQLTSLGRWFGRCTAIPAASWEYGVMPTHLITPQLFRTQRSETQATPFWTKGMQHQVEAANGTIWSNVQQAHILPMRF